MRNLKRALSLALAAVMVIGMMVTGAGASYDDFTDKDEIKNQEAVSTLVSLGVISGKEDGTYYDPTAVVTRAEMAKMITVALHGGKDPVLGTKDKPSFTDIKGTWAESYIEYCVSVGIISGRGDGRFDPTATVTGTEAAKMILVALGYDAKIFKFTGADWAINVNVRANDVRAKLYDGLATLNANAGLTRDNAAQMVYNGVMAQMLIMTPSQGLVSGEITYDYTYGGNMLRLKFDADVYVGQITSSEFAAIGGGTQKAGEFVLRAFMKNDENVASVNMTMKGDTTPDMLGKSYKVIVKDSKSAGVYNVVYGAPILSDMNNIYTTSARKGTSGLNTFMNDIKAAGITDLTGANVYVNYGYAPLTSPGAAITSPVSNNTANTGNWTDVMNMTGNGYELTIIDYNNDGIADYVMIEKPYIGEVSSYSATAAGNKGSISVSSKGYMPAGTHGAAITNEVFADVYGVEDVAKGDMVSYLMLAGDKFYVTKLESVEGTVKSVTGTTKLSLDGKTYTGSDLALTINEDYDTVNYHRGGLDTTGLKDAVTVGDKAKLYLDVAGNVAYISAVESADNYVMLSNVEIGGTVSGVKASAVFSDGTTSTISINSVTNAATKGGVTTKYSGAGNASDNLLNAAGNAFNANVDGTSKAGIEVGTGIAVYTYSVKSDGTYDLRTAFANDYASTTLNDNVKITKNSANIPGVPGSADSKTVFVVKNGSNWSVYTGVTNVPSLTTSGANAATVITDDNGDITVVYVKSSSVIGDRKSIYVLDKKVTASQDDKGNDIFTLRALVDGKWTEVKVDGANKNSVVTAGLYYDASTNNYISLDGNNAIALSAFGQTNVYCTPGKLTELKSDKITAMTADGVGAPNDTTTLTINSKTQIILIDGSAEGDISVGSYGDLRFDVEKDGAGNIIRNDSSVVAMVRASADSTSSDYGVAGFIYVIL